MKTLVTYYSDSGNTGKLAQAIYEGLGAGVKLKPVFLRHS
jgi:flavodoxin